MVTRVARALLPLSNWTAWLAWKRRSRRVRKIERTDLDKRETSQFIGIDHHSWRLTVIRLPDTGEISMTTRRGQLASVWGVISRCGLHERVSFCLSSVAIHAAVATRGWTADRVRYWHGQHCFPTIQLLFSRRSSGERFFHHLFLFRIEIGLESKLKTRAFRSVGRELRSDYFDEIQRKEPDQIPDPDNPSPCPTAALNVGERPIGPDSNECRDQLGDEESDDQDQRWTFAEEETMRTGDEYQCLTDRRNLKIDDRVEHRMIPPGVRRWLPMVLKLADTEMIMEERGLNDHCEKDDCRSSEIDAIDNCTGKDLREIPTVRVRRWFDTIFRYRQDRSIVENGEDEDLESSEDEGERDSRPWLYHEGRKVEFECKDQNREAD